MAPTTETKTKRTFVLGSRKSELAKVQTYQVRDTLAYLYPNASFELAFMSTGGDKNQSQALYLLGGKSLWTEELETALHRREVDLIVHCLKDMPTRLPENCEIGAILERADPRDAFVVKQGLHYKTLEELPDGSVIGTSSVRRVAQLKRAFPKLKFADVVSLFSFVQARSRPDNRSYDSEEICMPVCSPCTKKNRLLICLQ